MFGRGFFDFDDDEGPDFDFTIRPDFVVGFGVVFDFLEPPDGFPLLTAMLFL